MEDILAMSARGVQKGSLQVWQWWEGPYDGGGAELLLNLSTASETADWRLLGLKKESVSTLNRTLRFHSSLCDVGLASSAVWAGKIKRANEDIAKPIAFAMVPDSKTKAFLENAERRAEALARTGRRHQDSEGDAAMRFPLEEMREEMLGSLKPLRKI
jgi:hypothetical protein